MFKFLKDKLKSTIDKFTKKVEEEVKEEEIPLEEVPEGVKEEELSEEVIPEEKEEEPIEVPEETQDKPKEEVKEEISEEKEVIEEPEVVEEKEEVSEKEIEAEEAPEEPVEEQKEEEVSIEEPETPEDLPAPEEPKEDVDDIVSQFKAKAEKEKEEKRLREEAKKKEEKPTEDKKEELEKKEPSKEELESGENIPEEKRSFGQKLKNLFKKKNKEEEIKEEQALEEEKSEEAPLTEPKQVEEEFKEKYEKEEEKSEVLESTEGPVEDLEENLTEEDIKEELDEELKEEKPSEEKKTRSEPPVEEKEGIVEESESSKEEEKPEVEESAKKKGFFGKIGDTFTKKTLSEEKFDELFWDLELALLENNVAVSVVDKIRNDLKEELTTSKISRFGIDKIISNSLEKSINELFDVEQIDLKKRIEEKKPFIMSFIGINGTGKTTNLAKVAKYLKDQGFSVVVGAADTFRAAAIDQLEHHCENVGVKVIKHDMGSDAAAVAFDTIAHAKAKGKDVVLIDTAGRSNANANLMEELSKVNRVANPDLTIFIGDSLTGNDAVEQAQEFDAAVGIDGIILSKTDADEKGGAAISISYVTKKPILFVGTGQGYDDLKPFTKDLLLNNLGFMDSSDEEEYEEE